MKYTTPSPSNDSAAGTVITVILAVVIAALAFGVIVTLAWNYGVSEVLQSYGAGDHNINVIEGFFVGLFLACIGGGTSIKKGD